MIRLFDILISSLALILLSPLLIIISFILSMTGEREVIYLQKRIGKDYRYFLIIKFATMKKNSPLIGSKTITLENDSRILPLGDFLRKTKINELLQFLNVLKGDMSLIGPRPLTQEIFNIYPKNISKIISTVKPGISGLGSLIFKNEYLLLKKNKNIKQIYTEEISKYKGLVEKYYVQNFTPFSYFKILILTIIILLTNKSKLVYKFFPGLPRPTLKIKKQLNL
jgi:lipopolysaccharide/colanic/teichoic acid biosynthesis glycosyltransferase